MSEPGSDKKTDTLEKILGMTYRGIEPQPMPWGWEQEVLADIQSKLKQGEGGDTLGNGVDSFPEGTPEIGEKTDWRRVLGGKTVGWLLLVVALLILMWVANEYMIVLDDILWYFPEPALLQRILGL